MLRLILALSTLTLLSSCTHHTDPTPDLPKGSVLIEYHKTGGIAGVNDQITVTSNGEVTWQTRAGHGTDLLSPQHLTRLTEAFDNWDKYNPEYPAPSGARDHFSYDIAFNGKHVTFSDISPNLPTTLHDAAARVAELVKK